MNEEQCVLEAYNPPQVSPQLGQSKWCIHAHTSITLHGGQSGMHGTPGGHTIATHVFSSVLHSPQLLDGDNVVGFTGVPAHAHGPAGEVPQKHQANCHRRGGGSLPGLHTHMVAHVVHAAIVLSLSDVYPLLRVTTIILHIKQQIQLLFQQCLWVS